MSQDANSHQALLDLAEPNSSPPPWGQPFAAGALAESGGFSVESYADRLMDDLFEEVEQALAVPTDLPDSSALAPSTLAPVEAPSVSTESPAQSVEELSTSTALALQSQPEQLLSLEPDEPELIESPPLTSVPASTKEPDSSPSSGRFYDRLLLAVGCISIVLTLALWFLLQENKRQAPGLSMAANQVDPNASSVANSEFADYMERSLNAVERKKQSQSQTVAMVPPAPGVAGVPSALPTITVPVTPGAPLVNRVPNVAPRVYFPGSQIPSNFLPNRGQSPLGLVPVPGTPAITPRTAVRSPSALSVPGVVRNLKGIVEMGEKSAALIEINGVVQTYRPGESIGSGGWTLVEVSKSQAIIRRNGEVRSVFIGQSF